MNKLWLVVAIALAGCGSSSAAPSSSTEPSGARPVRVDEPASSARPVQVAPTVPGEAAASDDLADPPPVEAPTAH